MAKFTLNIKTDNAAFEDQPAIEIARILREAADRVEQSPILVMGILRDINGNEVGKWEASKPRTKR
jgi:hypothetical protein